MVIFNWLFNITLTESIAVSVVSMLITRMGDPVEHSELVPVLVVVAAPGNPHLKQGYVCEDCGEKGNGCEGWFDRTSPVGGLPYTWEKEDHWLCKKCWIGAYWLPGEWETKGDGSIWFESR